MMISEPGTYDLSDAAYHGDPCPTPSMSAGNAKRLLQATPMHAADEHPRLTVPGLPAKDPENDGTFDFGRAAHAVLTGKGGAIVEVDANDWRTKAAKEAREAAWAGGDTPLLSEQAARVRLAVGRAHDQLVASVGRNPFADLDSNELAMIWRDGPIWCRAKPDAMDYEHRILWDAKFTDGLADPQAWADTQIRATAIDLRAAHYLHGAKALLGPGWRYLFAVVEARRPHALSVVELTGEALDIGEDQRAIASRTWAHCLATGRWDAWAPGIHRPEPRAYQEARWIERRDSKPTNAALAIAREMQAP